MSQEFKELGRFRGKIVFPIPERDEEIFHDRDLVELHPFGLSFDGNPSRPVLLLKDKSDELTLPVVLNSLEAGVTLAQNYKNAAPLTPHHFLEALLKSLDITVVRCVFVEIKGEHQFVRLYLKGHPQTNSIKIRADEAMSLCFHLKVPFFATKDFIKRSRVIAAQAESELIFESQKGLEALIDKSHPYVM